MQDNPRFKELFTVILLIITVTWGVFAAIMTWIAATELEGATVLAAAGVDTFFGSLVAWDTLTIQYWFRKKPGDSDIGKPNAKIP